MFESPTLCLPDFLGTVQVLVSKIESVRVNFQLVSQFLDFNELVMNF